MQKVVIARWMRIGPEVLVLEDPTAGVDVGAKAEIYRLLAASPAMLGAQALVQGLLSGVGAVIAFTKAAALLGTARAAVFPAMVPAVAIQLGVPIAGEIPTLLQLAGVGIVTLSLLIALGVLKPTRPIASFRRG